MFKNKISTLCTNDLWFVFRTIKYYRNILHFQENLGFNKNFVWTRIEFVGIECTQDKITLKVLNVFNIFENH